MFKKPSFLMGFGEKTSYNYPFSWGGGFKMFKKPSFLMGFGEKTSYNYPFSWGGVQNVQKTFISHGFWGSIDIITVRFPKTKKNMEFSGVLTRSEGTSGRVSYIPLPKN